MEALDQIVFNPKKLRAAREAAFPNRSQADVAINVFGWNRQRLSGYETGVNDPDPNSLALMCKVYNVDLLRDLTGFDEEALAVKAA